MPREEVIRVLEQLVREGFISNGFCTGYRLFPLQAQEKEALKIAIDDIKKRIPTEPDWEGDGYDPDGNFIWDTWICPTCGERYEVDYDNHDYCPKCGQAILRGGR
ncbi:hypothetical protein AALA24_13540 [Anaerovoracaceae bacterium 42-11]